jgi:hypothetical protein
VIDHPSCLMTVACHPIIPSVVAVASFNGEVVVWDLTNLDKPVAISPSTEYSHKEPIIDIKWVPTSSSSQYTSNLGSIESWNLVSCGSDGKLLYWSVTNKFSNPIKGYTISKGKFARRQYPYCHGAASICTSANVNQTSNLNKSDLSPKWLIIGQEGGSLLRCQVSRLPNQMISQVILFSSQTSLSSTFPILSLLFRKA